MYKALFLQGKNTHNY